MPVRPLRERCGIPAPNRRGEIALGPYTLSVAKDCPISGGGLPLVVVSHGNRGCFLYLYDIAETLAMSALLLARSLIRADTTFDMSRFLSACVERPTDIRRLIDFMPGAWPAASKIDSERIGFYGFSLSGYTGLVLIGTNPDWASGTEYCERNPHLPGCEQVRR